MIELLLILISTVHLTVCYYHVTCAFQSESSLYTCLNVRERLARNRHEIWSLSDCNWTRTHNHLVHKRTLNHLAKLAKWFSCVVSIYLYGAFDSMLLSCHVRVSEWTTTECEFTLKRLRDTIIIYSQMHHTDKYSQHSSIIWPIWLHDWVFVYELSGCLIVLRTFCCWFFISSTTSSKTTLLITKLEWENTFYFKEDAPSKYKTKSLNLGWPETNNKKQSWWRILGGLNGVS